MSQLQTDLLKISPKLKYSLNFQGAKKIIIYSLPFRQAEASIYQPDIISTGPQNFLTGRIGHLHYDIILLLRPESFRVLLSVQVRAFVIETSLGLQNLNMKGKMKRILVVVVKWRHRANGLLISPFSCYLNSSKKITCPLGKLKTEFTSPIAKSTSPRLLDTTFFPCCFHNPFTAKVFDGVL